MLYCCLQEPEDYRNLLKALHIVEEDQHVYHIISKANGGANHVSNYHYTQNNDFNIAIHERHDYLNAYMAGLRKQRRRWW